MAYEEFYANLPGPRIEFGDLDLSRSVPEVTRTRSCIIFGVAKDGPLYEGVRLRSIDVLKSTYGGIEPTDPVSLRERSLVRVAKEVYASGCNDIVVVRVNGTVASRTLTGGGANKITLSSKFAGSKYNSFNITVDNTSGTITFNDGTEDTGSVTWTASTDMGTLIEQINLEAPNTGIIASIVPGADYRESPIVLDDVVAGTLSGGTDEYSLSDAQYSDALISGYRYNEFSEGRYATAAGAYITVSGTNQVSGDPVHFLQNLSQFCAVSTTHGYPRIGFMAASPQRPTTPLSVVEDRAATLSTIDLSTYIMNDYVPSSVALTYPLSTDPTDTYYAKVDTNGDRYSAGKFMAGIIAGPRIWAYNSFLGFNLTDAVGLVMGKKCVGVPWNNITGQVVPLKNGGLDYRYTLAQLDAITGNNMITFSMNNNGQVYCVDGPMMASNYYSRLGTADLFHTIASEISKICQKYLGQTADNITLGLIAQSIRLVLDRYTEAGAISDATGSVSTDGHVIDHKILVYIEARAPEEIRKVRINIQPLSPPNVSATI